MNSTSPHAQNPGNITDTSVSFLFENTPVRTVYISGDVWFVATDVCKVLGISKPGNAYTRLEADERGTHTVGTLGGPQEMTVISESGMYQLAFTSRKKTAKLFTRWVTSEVLPALRKKGKYELNAKVRQAKIEWQQARAEGRHIRRVETDAIKEFVEYARAQGSKNADKYYVNISRMENRALFFLEAGLEKPNNLRETLDLFQIQSLAVADRLVVKAVEEGMVEGLHYKEIFQRAKEKVVALSLVVGQTSLAQIPMREGAMQ